MRCCGPFESRYSLVHLQKFSTDIEKLSSAPSIHFSAAAWLWPRASLNAFTTSSRLNW